MRARTLTVSLVAVLVGASAAMAVLAGASAAMAFRTAVANRHAARVDAHHLLSSVRLPAGATLWRGDPSVGRRLGQANEAPASTALVDRHRFWRVPGDPAAVIAWLRAHPPARSQLTSTSSSGGPGYEIEGLAFSVPPVPNVILSRTLVFSVTTAAHGESAVRADAEIVWLKPRLHSERVPAGVTLVTLTDTRLNIHTGKSTTSAPIVVTVATKVDRIAQLVNGLAVDQLGIVPCPADFGPNVDIRFYGRQGGPVLAEANAEGSGCGTVSFTLNGRTEPTLIGGSGLIQHLDRLLGTQL
jgi:hypothetical protein